MTRTRRELGARPATARAGRRLMPLAGICAFVVAGCAQDGGYESAVTPDTTPTPRSTPTPRATGPTPVATPTPPVATLPRAPAPPPDAPPDATPRPERVP